MSKIANMVPATFFALLFMGGVFGGLSPSMPALADSENPTTASDYSIPVDCGNIDRICSPFATISGKKEETCPTFAWTVQSIADIKSSCEKSGLRNLSVSTLSDSRFKAWLLVYHLDKLLPQGPTYDLPITHSWFGGTDIGQNNVIPTKLNDSELRGLLQLVSTALAPEADAQAVHHRFNQLPFERMDLVSRFVHLIYTNPKVGAEFIPQLYSIALYDSNSGVRATASDFLSSTDSNRQNVEALIRYLRRDPKDQFIFIGNPRATSGHLWTYEPASQFKSIFNDNSNLQTFLNCEGDSGCEGFYSELQQVFNSPPGLPTLNPASL